MSIETGAELEGLLAIGRIVRAALDAAAAAVRAGVTTGELDEISARVLASRGAIPAPPLIYGFPAATCISVNEQAIHGIPGDRALRGGDLVKLDIVAARDGFFADAAVTVEVGVVAARARELRCCAERAFRRGLAAARPGARAWHVGGAIEREVKRRGFRVVRGLSGHGVGRTIHEPPTIPNEEDRSCDAVLTEGLVITIEPIVAAGRSGRAVLQADGWTVSTADRSLSAHYEHTIVVTSGAPILVTAA